MIIKIICNYCGREEITSDRDASKVTIRCPICTSKRIAKEYQVVDSYKDCPPFPKKEIEITELTPMDLDNMNSESNYGYPRDYNYSYD